MIVLSSGGREMNQTEELIEGTLNPDGTLTLDHEPQLPAGRVRVLIQVASSVPPHRRGLADVIDEIRAEQQARGFAGRTAGELRAWEDARTAEDEEYERRMRALRSQANSASQGTP
jgi:hypothetical protein